MHSANVDEVYSEDFELRRKMRDPLRKQLAEEQALDKQEIRGHLRHVQEERTGLWEVEYRRMMDDIKRRKGLSDTQPTMRSMTGFGARGQRPIGGGQLSLELRALNHRFVDVRVRLPTELADQASFVEQLVRDRVERGRVDVSVRLSGAALPPARFSAERARSLHAVLSGLKDELAPGSELPFSTLASFAPLLLEPAVADLEEVRRALSRALEHAFDELRRMRETEGDELARELGQRLEAAKGLAHANRASAHSVSLPCSADG